MYMDVFDGEEAVEGCLGCACIVVPFGLHVLHMSHFTPRILNLPLPKFPDGRVWHGPVGLSGRCTSW